MNMTSKLKIFGIIAIDRQDPHQQGENQRNGTARGIQRKAKIANSRKHG